MKRIRVHLDASPQAEARLVRSQQLASRHGAELSAFCGVMPEILASPWASGDGLAAAATLLAEIDRGERARDRATFGRTTARGALHWLDGEWVLGGASRSVLAAMTRPVLTVP